MGLDQECRAASEALRTVLIVVSVEGPRVNRGDSDLVRYYVETRGLK